MSLNRVVSKIAILAWQRGEGVGNSQNIRDVIYECPLTKNRENSNYIWTLWKKLKRGIAERLQFFKWKVFIVTHLYLLSSLSLAKHLYKWPTDTTRVAQLVAHQLVMPKVVSLNPRKGWLLSWPKRDNNVTFWILQIINLNEKGLIQFDANVMD